MVDKFLNELAAYYELEINERSGCSVIDLNGNERPAVAEDAISLFGIDEMVVCDDYITTDNIEYSTINQWVIIGEYDKKEYRDKWLEVA